MEIAKYGGKRFRLDDPTSAPTFSDLTLTVDQVFPAGHQ
jgi:hypothetical protein